MSDFFNSSLIANAPAASCSTSNPRFESTKVTTPSNRSGQPCIACGNNNSRNWVVFVITRNAEIPMAVSLPASFTPCSPNVGMPVAIKMTRMNV